MHKYANPEFGEISRITEEGVFCISASGEERKVFTLGESYSDEFRVPNLTFVKITPSEVTCYWGEPDHAPMVTFERV